MIRAASAILAVVSVVSTVSMAQEAPQMPAPQKEHEWLQQLVGEWESEAEASFGPDQPPIKCKGTEKIRSLGGFWILSDSQGEVMGTTMRSQMTLGYDTKKKKYVGTWVDSMTDYMWHYEGTLDESGKILTLEAEGYSYLNPTELAKFKDVIELKDKDHKVLRSSMQMPDGKWVNFMTGNYTRKK